MKKMKFFRVISTLMAVVTLATCLGMNPVLAAELDEVEAVEQQVETESSITPYSGVETLPLGDYLISSRFSVTGHNYSPVKTVQGRYLRILYKATLNVVDFQLQPGRIKIIDYYTKEVLSDSSLCCSSNNSGVSYQTVDTDLGRAGRKIQIYTVVTSSNGQEVQNTVTFTDYRSRVHN